MLKRKTEIILMFLAMLMVGTGCSAQDQETNDAVAIVQNISVQDLEKMISSGEAENLLDVRTPGEWDGGIIEGALKMNFHDSDFKDQFSELDPNEPWIVYCAAGGRSAKAAKQMLDAGFTNVYNVLGGFGAWQNAGMKVAN